jgi:hypothetical protein
MSTNAIIPSFYQELPSGYVWDTKLDRDSDEVMSFIRSIWPNYLTEQPDINILVPYDVEIYNRYYAERYFLWGVRRIKDQQLVACLSCASVDLEQSDQSLSQQGWQWAKQNSMLSDELNCLCLLSATVATEERANGLAKALIESAKQLAKSLNFCLMIAPARPSAKHRFPELSMEEYLALSGHRLSQLPSESKRLAQADQQNSIPADPWLKIHLDLGATILNICEQSIEVVGSIDWWQQLLGISFAGKAKIDIAAGLVPLVIDWEKNLATYQEPNIWLKYELSDD